MANSRFYTVGVGRKKKCEKQKGILYDKYSMDSILAIRELSSLYTPNIQYSILAICTYVSPWLVFISNLDRMSKMNAHVLNIFST